MALHEPFGRNWRPLTPLIFEQTSNHLHLHSFVLEPRIGYMSVGCMLNFLAFTAKQQRFNLSGFVRMGSPTDLPWEKLIQRGPSNLMRFKGTNSKAR